MSYKNPIMLPFTRHTPATLISTQLTMLTCKRKIREILEITFVQKE